LPVQFGGQQVHADCVYVVLALADVGEDQLTLKLKLVLRKSRVDSDSRRRPLASAGSCRWCTAPAGPACCGRKKGYSRAASLSVVSAILLVAAVVGAAHKHGGSEVAQAVCLLALIADTRLEACQHGHHRAVMGLLHQHQYAVVQPAAEDPVTIAACPQQWYPAAPGRLQAAPVWQC